MQIVLPSPIFQLSGWWWWSNGKNVATVNLNPHCPCSLLHSRRMEQPKQKRVLRKKKKTMKKALDEDVERLKMEKEEEDKEKMLLINSIVTKCNLSEEKVMILN